MKNLFTVQQVAKCTGLSRSTLLRLEQLGILTPSQIKADSGYRYYDVTDVTQVMQIKLLLEMGLQYSDICEYYASGGNSVDVAQRLRQRLDILKRGVEEMELRTKGEPDMKAELIRLPQYVCYTKTSVGKSAADKYQAMYNTYHEVIEKGYRPLATEPIFGIAESEDYLAGVNKGAEHKIVCCIPLEPDSAPEEAVVIPACQALSVLYYGDYEHLPDAYLFLAQKMRELDLKPAGYIRTLGIVAPATGNAIAPSRYISRLALPVEERT